MRATPTKDGHSDLHSEMGALRHEHPGRARNPLIKVEDIAWLAFEKSDLHRAAAFARAFGFTVLSQTRDELALRGALDQAASVFIRRGPRTKFVGPAFLASDTADLVRLADAHRHTVTPLPESVGGHCVELTDPSGLRVLVVAGTHAIGPGTTQTPHTLNVGSNIQRTNIAQRPPRQPATVERLGHVVLQSNRYRETLDWYLENLGMIVSDFLFYDGLRDRGPVMSFIRCDRGDTPADHHTLALLLGPSNRYVHSAYQVSDLDALASGGEYLADLGYKHSWGIGRHIQGSQIFDYWRDPDGVLVEHFTDGDMFDASLEPGWAPMTVSGLAQWGPPASKDFLGLKPGRDGVNEVASMLRSLRSDNEFDLRTLIAMAKCAAR